MGPFELMDLIGNDVNFRDQLGFCRHVPRRTFCSLQQQERVAAGWMDAAPGGVSTTIADRHRDLSCQHCATSPARCTGGRRSWHCAEPLVHRLHSEMVERQAAQGDWLPDIARELVTGTD
jgi:3-hydroxyacyl-CoA dehydrogenase